MSFFVTPAMQLKYKNNVELVLQQTKSMLMDKVTVQNDTSADKVKIKDLIGNTTPNEASERHGDTRYNNPTYDGVWVSKPNELYYADLIDNADRLGTSIDLQGASTMTGAATVARAKDQRILEGFYGSVISGKDGTTTTAFPGGQIIPVTTGGASGAQKMSTAKLRAATKLLLQGYADLPGLQRWMILTADDNDALLTEVPATSADFKESFSGVVSNGLVQSMLGWNFVHMELDNPLLGTIPGLATDGSGYRKTPFWAKQGVVANVWQDLNTSVDKMPGKQLSIQVYAGTTLAATRTQPGYSGIILNAKG